MIRCHKKIIGYILAFYYFLNPLSLKCQELLPGKSVDILYANTDSATFLIKNFNFSYNPSQRNLLPVIFNTVDGFNSYYDDQSKLLKSPYQIKVEHCVFDGDNIHPMFPHLGVLAPAIDFKHCKWWTIHLTDLDVTNSPIVVEGLNHSRRMILIDSNQADAGLQLDRLKGYLWITNNRIKGVSNVYASRVGINVHGNNLQENYGIDLNTSNSDIEFIKNTADVHLEAPREHFESNTIQRHLSYFSQNDTIHKIYFLNPKKSISNLKFQGTFFNGDYQFDQSAPFKLISSEDSQTNINFTDCSFDDKTELYISNADSITFRNCELLVPLFLRINSENRKKLILTLDEEDFSNLNFDFYKHMDIGFRSGLSEDGQKQIFSRLLEKFKKEGKSDSYMYVDLLYIKYKYKKSGFLVRCLGFVDEIWWNYGYDKGRIIFIIIGALAFFFLVNLSLSKGMLEFYPVLKLSSQRQSSRVQKKINHIVIILILTIYIFFSLRIELDKIDASRNRMVVYFFFQYFFGLICLLFLFGAILKF